MDSAQIIISSLKTKFEISVEKPTKRDKQFVNKIE